MNKYLQELIDDLIYLKPEDYEMFSWSYYPDEDTVSHEDTSEYYLWIPIKKEDIAAKAINEENSDAYTYQICYQVDRKECLFGVLGDANLEEITKDVDPEVRKIFKNYAEECIAKNKNITGG